MAVAESLPGQEEISPRNRDQERIVRYLAEQVKRELAGEAERFIEKAWPHRRLQLGVLPPLPPPVDLTEEVDGSDDGKEHAAARAEASTAPSTMAIDFLYGPEAGRCRLELEAAFSVYVQRYPS